MPQSIVLPFTVGPWQGYTRGSYWHFNWDFYFFAWRRCTESTTIQTRGGKNSSNVIPNLGQEFGFGFMSANHMTSILLIQEYTSGSDLAFLFFSFFKLGKPCAQHGARTHDFTVKTDMLYVWAIQPPQFSCLVQKRPVLTVDTYYTFPRSRACQPSPIFTTVQQNMSFHLSVDWRVKQRSWEWIHFPWVVDLRLQCKHVWIQNLA